MMRFQHRMKLFLVGIACTTLFLQGCSTKGDDENIQTLSGLSCSTSATVSSGNINSSNALVTLSNLNVFISNGSGSSYTLSLPNGASVTANSSSYTYPNTLSLTTGASGGISSSVSVLDNGNGATTVCSLIISPTGGTGGTTTISLSASPSTVAAVNSSVTVTATASSVSSPVFSFTQTSTSPSSVTLTNPSNGVATITSSVAQTVTVTATMISNSSGAATSSNTITLIFSGSGTGSATLNLAASTTSSPVGTPISLNASVSGISDPYYQFSLVSSTSGTVSISASGSFASVSASTATTAVIRATAISLSNASLTATSTITLVFSGGGSGSGSVVLSVYPSNSVSVNTTVTVTASVSGIVDPVYSFFFLNNNPTGAVGTFNGNVATFYSTLPGILNVMVQVYSASNPSITATNQTAITVSSGTSTNLTCTLGHFSGTYYRGSAVPFYISSNTGEALVLTYWNPGEAWANGPPPFPFPLTMSGGYGYFYATYSSVGTKSVQIIAESATRPGVKCNGGSILTDSVYIY